jgi:hypothetical protein
VSTAAQLVSTVATGTAPLSVASTTQVPNLNASQLGGLSASAFALLSGGNTFIGNQTVAGNVGIGTATPAAALEVNGTAKFDQAVTFAASQSFATTSGTAMFTDSTSNQVLDVTQTGLGATAVLNNTGGGAILQGQQNSTAVFTVTNNGGLTSSALVLQPSVTESSSGNTYVSANVIGGFAPGTNVTGANVITAGVTGATIAGGGGTFNSDSERNIVTDDWGIVGGGYHNQAGNGTGTVSDAIAATVGGGFSNTASGSGATVGGGSTNAASGWDATVAGGELNTSSGARATVGGGTGNSASGLNATVPGGLDNISSGAYSFAAGCQANAANPGAFVWSGFDGGTNCPSPSSTAAGQFIAAAPGGVLFYSNTALTAGVTLASGGNSWTMVSDRHAKRNFQAVGGEDLLAKLNRIPMSVWSYKSQNSSILHLGPMAQDFYAAFHLGETDKGIDEIDGQGVALAGVQALYRLGLEADSQIRALAAHNRKLTEEVERLKKVETEMATLEARLARLETGKNSTRAAHSHGIESKAEKDGELRKSSADATGARPHDSLTTASANNNE